MTALSPDKKCNLLFVYVTQGFTAAKPLAIEYGVSPRIMAKYTREVGIKGTIGRVPKKPKAKPKNPDRWKWAIQRGGISL